jgi:hypothetical protein
MDLFHSLGFGPPELGLDHPSAQRFPAHLYLVLPCQILGRQRRSESLINILAQDLDGLVPSGLGDLSIGSPPVARMNDRFVPSIFQAPQHTPYLPLAYADLGCRLLLRDQLLLGFIQRHQPVALFLRHQELVRFQLPSLPPSIGHSCFALLGHSHFAPTMCAERFTGRHVPATMHS